MKYKNLGSTDLRISEIGLGCASYWGKRAFDENKAIELVHKSIERGVNFFDTGHSYSDGNAEPRLGKALWSTKNKNDLLISSKAGTRIDHNKKLYKDFSPEWLEKSCHMSIKNLGIEALGMFQLHGPALENLNDEVLSKLLSLKQKGCIQSIGINTFDTTVIESLIKINVFDFVMLDYNILRQDREPLIRELNNKGIGVIAGAALAESLYSNRIFKIKSFKDMWYLARALKNFRHHLKKGFDYRFINNYKEMTGSQIALAYILKNSNISSAVFGTTSMEHLEENLASCDITLSQELQEKIKSKANKPL